LAGQIEDGPEFHFGNNPETKSNQLGHPAARIDKARLEEIRRRLGTGGCQA
jgi:hypothetical protein